MIAARLVNRAKTVRIEDEIARRNITLKGRIDQCGPCPVCGGTDQFAINVRKQVFVCRGCRVGGDVISLVQHLDGCAFAEAVEILAGDAPRRTVTLTTDTTAARKQTVEEYERQQHEKARRMWSRHKPISGTLAERYLRSRGITCALPRTLGFLQPYKKEHHPALIAAFGLCDEPEPGALGLPPLESVHLTLLHPDGTKKADVEKPKIVVGSPGALPIVLAPPTDLLGLVICEGIEDALTAHQVTGLGAWAASCAARLRALANAVPGYIECVTIYAHNDEGGEGQNGMLQLAQALDKRGIEVMVEGL